MAVSFDVVGAAGQTWITLKRRSSMRWRLTTAAMRSVYAAWPKAGRSADPRVLAVLGEDVFRCDVLGSGSSGRCWTICAAASRQAWSFPTQLIGLALVAA